MLSIGALYGLLLLLLIEELLERSLVSYSTARLAYWLEELGLGVSLLLHKLLGLHHLLRLLSIILRYDKRLLSGLVNRLRLSYFLRLHHLVNVATSSLALPIKSG